ncbi:hypothetical protein [Marispirochaeta sp.]|jgi:hypothetical protein|uniref:hypothetical protein n=1 Tax=Marispirochaeta sp. TaxID=2038653 RepID=UPI0029C75CE6|nr:hypothetical protein [Marispirochaeta sp.]
MKQRYHVLLCLLGVIGCLLFFPRDLSSALTFTPQALYDLTASRTGQAAAKPVPFVSSGFAGFLDENGRPQYVEKIRYGAAVSSMGIINYDSVSTKLVMRNRDGEIQVAIETRGYPFFLKERLLIISTDRLRLKEYTTDGDLLWSATFPSPVTACAAAGNRFLIGLLNGNFLYLNEAGEPLYSFTPPEGRIKVAYGAAMDAASEASLVVAGIDPQTAYLLEERNGELNSIESFPLGSDLRRNLLVSSLHGGRFAIEQEQGLLVVDRTNLRRRYFSIPGRLLSVQGHPESNLLSALSQDDSDRFVSMIGSESNYRGRLRLAGYGPGTSILWSGNRFIILVDGHVLVYRLELI